MPGWQYWNAVTCGLAAQHLVRRPAEACCQDRLHMHPSRSVLYRAGASTKLVCIPAFRGHRAPQNQPRLLVPPPSSTSPQP